VIEQQIGEASSQLENNNGKSMFPSHAGGVGHALD
jgi:hypothetical protein